MFNGNSLVLSIIFGLVGSAYLMYGKRQLLWTPTLVGMALIALL